MIQFAVVCVRLCVCVFVCISNEISNEYHVTWHRINLWQYHMKIWRQHWQTASLWFGQTIACKSNKVKSIRLNVDDSKCHSILITISLSLCLPPQWRAALSFWSWVYGDNWIVRHTNNIWNIFHAKLLKLIEMCAKLNSLKLNLHISIKCSTFSVEISIEMINNYYVISSPFIVVKPYFNSQQIHHSKPCNLNASFALNFNTNEWMYV